MAKIAAGESKAADFAILGDDTLAWRSGETGRLVDVINQDFDSTPIVADADGEWHVRIRGRWRPLILDDAVATLGFGARGLAGLDLKFGTKEWAWRWAAKPELADLASGRVRTPSGTSWLPGDQIAAFIGDGSRLYATDTGVRFSMDVPPLDGALPRFGSRPKSVRTEAGTMFVTRTKDSLIGFTAGEWRTIPRDDARLVADGEQLRLILRENRPADLAWRVRSDSSDDGFLQLAPPTSSLEGDQVLGTVVINGRLLAITPLGLFDVQQSATPLPGPGLARDARRIEPPGIAWLEIDEQEMERYLVTGDRGGYRIIEEDARTIFPFARTFDDQEPIRPIFSGRRWNLIQRFESDGQPTVL
ncbi:MAG: hypothetical protein GY895_16105, partial [Phycisphaera sp.]|nr:hypothetical protein [Phycisphaera sp.]